MNRHWTAKGFWLLLGLAAGMIVADLTNLPSAHAVASNSRDDNLIATGSTEQTEIEAVWLLDYGQAKLFYITMGPQGTYAGMTSMDLIQAFELDDAQGEQPHFMMVTGRFQTRGLSDLLYLAETNSQKMLVITVPTSNPRTFAPVGEPRVVASVPYGGVQ